MNNSLYIFTIDSLSDSKYEVDIYPNLISSGGSNQTHRNIRLNFDGYDSDNMDMNFAVYDKKIYAVAHVNTGDTYGLFVFDINSVSQSATYVSYKSVKEFELNTVLNISTAAESDSKIYDILYQDGCVYMLYKEKITTTEQDFYSRGCVIKYDFFTKETSFIGLTTNCLAKNSGFKLKTLDSYDKKILYTESSCTEQYLPEVYGDDNTPVSSAYVNLFFPAENEKSFYGPTKFIAVKPKQLVIADEGYYFYTDNENFLKFTNVNNVVLVDLEDFSVGEIISIDPEISMSEDDADNMAMSSISLDYETTFFTSIGEFSNDSCYIGAINDDITQ